MGYPPVSARLHTRYSPVRRSPSRYCYLMMPLDLHVLSLSLAFILSQDQTLHSIKIFIFSVAQFLYPGIYSKDSHLLFVSNLSISVRTLSFLFRRSTTFLEAKADAKIMLLFFLMQIFYNIFFSEFFNRKPLIPYYKTICRINLHQNYC